MEIGRASASARVSSELEKGRDAMRGTMLWFNNAKDLGFILTDEGERLSVLGSAFAHGVRPEGRCAHSIVTFEINDDGGDRQANNVTVVEEAAPRRARLRTRRISTH
jgi:cold shock CspA family protein